MDKESTDCRQWTGNHCDLDKRILKCIRKSVDECGAYIPPVDSDKKGEARTFDTGATRDTDVGKFDFEGFLSPIVLYRFAEFMHKHRIQSDGELRDSDNWQKGIPTDQYIKSDFRHFVDQWLEHRGYQSPREEDIEEALCAELFNTMGYLHEILKARGYLKKEEDDAKS